jgi:threonine aldolase
MPIARREFLACGLVPALAGAVNANAAQRPDTVQDSIVHFCSDGLSLSPVEYAGLLGRLAEHPGIEVDNYSRNGVVALLEEKMATLLGKEMAVYLPTGTLANHLAVRLLAAGRRRVLVQQESHLYNDAGDCAQQLCGLTLVPLAAGRATFTLEGVVSEIRRLESGRVQTAVGAISIESPVRRASGEVFNFEEMKKISEYGRARGIGLHLDGARVFLASAYTGLSPESYSVLFDTVYVSLYKYFNSASGAILAGPSRLLRGLYHERRMFGGGLSQVWPDAAIALHYLDGFLDRFARAASVAEELFLALAANPRCQIDRKPNGTNVARLQVKGVNAASLPERLRMRGVTISPAQRVTSEAAEFVLLTNESLLRRPASEIIGAFVEALA